MFECRLNRGDKVYLAGVKKMEKILMEWNLTAESAKIWVETINRGLKIGEFSTCWTY